MFKFFSNRTEPYASLSGPEFKEAIDCCNNPVLIDVRTAGEFAAGSIKGARNIDIMSPDFNKQIEALDKRKEYFLFCRSGQRSQQACGRMASAGFKVHNLKGGIAAWPKQ